MKTNITIIIVALILGISGYATLATLAEQQRALACENQGRTYGLQRKGLAVFNACSPTPTGKKLQVTKLFPISLGHQMPWELLSEYTKKLKALNPPTSWSDFARRDLPNVGLHIKLIEKNKVEVTAYDQGGPYVHYTKDWPRGEKRTFMLKDIPDGWSDTIIQTTIKTRAEAAYEDKVRKREDQKRKRGVAAELKRYKESITDWVSND